MSRYSGNSYPVDMYRERMEAIRAAIQRLHQRSPETLVVIKSANTRMGDELVAGDWLAYQLDLVMREMFEGMDVVLVDAWEMTTAQQWHGDAIHPTSDIVIQELEFLNAVYARPPLMFLEGPSYRSESFELHKILRAVRRGQFSAPAKFTPAPPTPSQSLASPDASSVARAAIKRCTNFAGTVASVLRADTGLLERCRASLNAIKHYLRIRQNVPADSLSADALLCQFDLDAVGAKSCWCS
ncbi:Neurexophilin [Branchiostoma belcheri]|nr:Neurexophilin [Branchiostoma belcheri]